MNRKLTDMDRDKNEIIGIVGHDMRNPVSTVIMVTRNLLEDFDNFTKEEIKSTSQKRKLNRTLLI